MSEQTTTTQRTDGPNDPEETRYRGEVVLGTAKEMFAQNRLALAGLVITVGVIFTAIFAPLLAPYDPTEMNIAEAQLEAPSLDHPFGTDQFGRDILSRVIYGARLSLEVGLIAVGVAIALGVPLGLLAGYYEGYRDEFIMRSMDVLFSFPAIILAIALVAVLGQSLVNLMIAIGVVYTPIFARVTRSSVLSVREETFVTAARATGASDFSIIVRDVLPNVAAPIIVQATVSLAFAILAEASLSFLGLGADLSQPSWGRMLANSQPFMQTAPWTVVFPGLAIMVTILGFNFLGDGLRDTLDPKQDTSRGGGL